MTDIEVLKHLVNDDFKYGIAEVICDACDNGKVVKPNVSVLVIVLNREEYCVNDDQIDARKHWRVCESIDDFIDLNTIKELTNFKEVKVFLSDFDETKF